jgi:hypothetical protein
MEFYVLRLVVWPAKAHKTIFAPINICILFFLQTFITNNLRNVKKPGRRVGRLIN